MHWHPSFLCLQGKGNFKQSKQRSRRENGSAEAAQDSGPDGSAGVPQSLLVPMAALQQDGEAAYLEEFRVETTVDDRHATSVTPLAQVRQMWRTHKHTLSHTVFRGMHHMPPYMNTTTSEHGQQHAGPHLLPTLDRRQPSNQGQAIGVHQGMYAGYSDVSQPPC